MKHAKNILIILFALAISSCTEEIYKATEYVPVLVDEYLVVNPRDHIGVPCNGGEYTGVVECDRDWYFSGVPEWIKINPHSGSGTKEYTISVSPHKGSHRREALFSAYSGRPDKTFSVAYHVEQKEHEPFISFAYNTYEKYSFNAQTIKIKVGTNIEDLAVVDPRPESWVSASYSKGELTVNLSENTDFGSAPRQARVGLRSKEFDYGQSIVITQIPADIHIYNLSNDFTSRGGKLSSSIESELPWMLKVSVPWLSVDKESGEAGYHSIEVSCLKSTEAYSRVGDIYLYYQNDTVNIRGVMTVTQRGTKTDFSPTALRLKPDGTGDGLIQVYSDIPWKVSQKPSWVHVDPMSGGGGGATQIKVWADKNTDANRFDRIYFQNSKSGASIVAVSVTQPGTEIIDHQYVKRDSNTIQFQIPAQESWTAVASVPWISLSQYAGDGGELINISFEENMSYNNRMGSVEIRSDNKYWLANFIQHGAYGDMPLSTEPFSSEKSQLSLSVPEFMEISKLENENHLAASWVEPKRTSSTCYDFTLQPNPSIYDRTAYCIFKSKNSDETYCYKVMQKGRELSTQLYEYESFAHGGISDTYSVRADGAYTIAKRNGDDWYKLHVNREENTFRIEIKPNASGFERNGEIYISLANLPDGEAKTITITLRQLGY